MARSYVSPVRRAQAEQTRARILEAVATLTVRRPDGTWTFEDIAAEAGVSPRTVYRHFPHRQDLQTALYERMVAGIGATGAPPPDDLTTWQQTLRRVLRAALDDEPFQRALLVAAADPAARRYQAEERLATVEAALGPRLDGLDPAEQDRIVGLLRVVASTTTLFQLVDTTRLDPDGAVEAIVWAVATLADVAAPASGVRPEG
jgi:AcrR family transcriptional regulator